MLTATTAHVSTVSPCCLCRSNIQAHNQTAAQRKGMTNNAGVTVA